MESTKYQELKQVALLSYDDGSEESAVQRIQKLIDEGLEEAERYRRDPRIGGSAAEAAISKLDTFVAQLEERRARLQASYAVHAQARATMQEARQAFLDMPEQLSTPAERKMFGGSLGDLPEKDFDALQQWRNNEREAKAQAVLERMNSDLSAHAEQFDAGIMTVADQTQQGGRSSVGAVTGKHWSGLAGRDSGSGRFGDASTGSARTDAHVPNPILDVHRPTAGLGGVSAPADSGWQTSPGARGSARPEDSGWQTGKPDDSGWQTGSGRDGAGRFQEPPALKITRPDGSHVSYQPPGIDVNDPRWHDTYRPPGISGSGASAGLLGTAGVAGGALAARKSTSNSTSMNPAQMLHLSQATGAGSAAGLRPATRGASGSSAGLANPIFAGGAVSAAPNPGGTAARGARLGGSAQGGSGQRPILSAKTSPQSGGMLAAGARGRDEEEREGYERANYQVVRLTDDYAEPQWLDAYGPGSAADLTPTTKQERDERR